MGIVAKGRSGTRLEEMRERVARACQCQPRRRRASPRVRELSVAARSCLDCRYSRTLDMFLQSFIVSLSDFNLDIGATSRPSLPTQAHIGLFSQDGDLHMVDGNWGDNETMRRWVHQLGAYEYGFVAEKVVI